MKTSKSFDHEVTIYLVIESIEFSPSILSEKLGVQPYKSWVIGDPRGKTGKHWDSHGWLVETMVSSKEFDGRSPCDLIPIAIERFENMVAPFAKSVALLGSSAEPYTILDIFTDYVPGIILSHSFLLLLGDIGGTFQVDLRIPAPDEGE